MAVTPGNFWTELTDLTSFSLLTHTHNSYLSRRNFTMMADYNPRPKKIKKTGDNLELRFTELGFQ